MTGVNFNLGWGAWIPFSQTQKFDKLFTLSHRYRALNLGTLQMHIGLGILVIGPMRFLISLGLTAAILATAAVIGGYIYLKPGLPDVESLRTVKLQTPLQISSPKYCS